MFGKILDKDKLFTAKLKIKDEKTLVAPAIRFLISQYVKNRRSLLDSERRVPENAETDTTANSKENASPDETSEDTSSEE